MKTICTNLLLVILGIAIALSLFEGFFHLFPGLLPAEVKHRTFVTEHFNKWQEGLVKDDDLDYKFKPDVNDLLDGHPEFEFELKTTSLGFNDVGFRDDGINDQAYAVVVGDSFAFAYGVNMEDGWVELLEKRTGIDFANLGMPGYGSTQSTRMLEKYGIELRPKLVLWAFFPNDFDDAWRFEEYLEKRLKPGAQDKTEQKDETIREIALGRTLDNFLHRNSLTYELIRLALQLGTYRRTDFVTCCNEKNLHVITYESYWKNKIDLSNSKIQRGYELTQQAILEAKRASDQAGADFVVLLLPCKIQVYWHLCREKFDQPDLWDVDGPNELIRQFCEDNNIHCLDLTPGFRERAFSGDQLYFNQDAHWNEQGHQLAAQLIYDYLLKQGLLPVRE